MLATNEYSNRVNHYKSLLQMAVITKGDLKASQPLIGRPICWSLWKGSLYVQSSHLPKREKSFAQERVAPLYLLIYIPLQTPDSDYI